MCLKQRGARCNIADDSTLIRFMPIDPRRNPPSPGHPRPRHRLARPACYIPSCMMPSHPTETNGAVRPSRCNHVAGIRRAVLIHRYRNDIPLSHNCENKTIRPPAPPSDRIQRFGLMPGRGRADRGLGQP
jgi:hypothetical protein